MFYTGKHFEAVKTLDVDTRNLVAKIANQLIEKHGKTIYGTKYSNGDLENFSGKKDASDMHVAIALGIQEMGLLPLDDRLVNAEPISDEEKALQKDKYLSELERENKVLRVNARRFEKPHAPGGHPYGNL